MKNLALVSVSLLSLMAGAPAMAADLEPSVLPAVSGVNGKVEFDAGWAGITNFDDSAAFRGGASISLPLAERFGLQLDLADVNQFNANMLGGTAHFFTRDPNSYLFGVIGGAATTSNNSNIYYAGPEVELYTDNFTLEATGGYLNVNLAGASSGKLFAIGDIAFYANENLRLNVGASSIAGFTSGHIGGEYLISDVGLPVSLTADARIGQDNFLQGTVGVKFYFGGPEKSLIRRQREDDPRNRSLDIFNSAGSAFTPPAAGAPACPQGETLVAGECINSNPG
jgi:hypothetical protein